MGCGGCELFPSPAVILAAIDRSLADLGVRIDSRAIYKELISSAHSKINTPLSGHKNAVSSTNIWHLRKDYIKKIIHDHGKVAGSAAENAIRQSISCYAAILHLNKAQALVKPERKFNKGYAPTFESVTQYQGRSEKTAHLKDLLGLYNPATPWKDRLPRLIFVSDMGDALSTKADFPFLKSDLMPAIASKKGSRHIWLWLTKRPQRLAEFAEEIGELPPNVCAMTTLTGADEDCFERLAALKKVSASMKGLSIEPLWERIPPSKLDLNGIDWVIVGGESGAGLKFTRPFALEWAEELRDHCKKNGVAFFLKQLGRNPSRDGKIFRLKNSHGGDWDEWPESLKIREFPECFHNYRKAEMKHSSVPRPFKAKNKLKESPVSLETSKEALAQEEISSNREQQEFKRLDSIVRNGIDGFAKAGEALAQIHDRKLWNAGGFSTWEAYCRNVAGMSRTHAFRLMKASECFAELKAMSDMTLFPVSESQVRPLLRLENSEDRKLAWDTAVIRASETQPTATDVREVVVTILEDGYDGGILSEKPPTRAQRRVEIISKLRTEIKMKESWEQVEKLLAELEEIL